jgi:uroporphyrinogen-III synthase
VTAARALVVRSGSHPFPRPESGAGLELVERVSHEVEPVEVDAEDLAARADYVIFTSQVAVARVLDGELGASVRRCNGQVVAVGLATADAIRARGLAPAIVAEGSAESVLDALPARLDGLRVLLPRGEDASPLLPGALRFRGADVRAVVVYRKTPNPPDPALAAEILENPFAAFCATSPSAAEWLFDTVGAAAGQALRAVPAVALGEATLQCLSARGVAAIVLAEQARFSAAARLLAALATGPPGQ